MGGGGGGGFLVITVSHPKFFCVGVGVVVEVGLGCDNCSSQCFDLMLIIIPIRKPTLIKLF